MKHKISYLHDVHVKEHMNTVKYCTSSMLSRKIFNCQAFSKHGSQGVRGTDTCMQLASSIMPLSTFPHFTLNSKGIEVILSSRGGHQTPLVT